MDDARAAVTTFRRVQVLRSDLSLEPKHVRDCKPAGLLDENTCGHMHVVCYYWTLTFQVEVALVPAALQGIF